MPHLQLGTVDAPKLSSVLQRKKLSYGKRHCAKVLRHDCAADAHTLQVRHWAGGGKMRSSDGPKLRI